MRVGSEQLPPSFRRLSEMAHFHRVTRDQPLCTDENGFHINELPLDSDPKYMMSLDGISHAGDGTVFTDRQRRDPLSPGYFDIS